MMHEVTKETGAKQPIWKAIAEALRCDLAEGRYAVGDKLPTEAALAARFGVNRHTVRHGLSLLVAQGFIRTRRGAGVFVARVPTDYPIDPRVRFHESLLAAGRKPEKRLLHLEARASSKGEAEALDIALGARVCSYCGISYADHQPIALFESLFPISRLPRIMDAFRGTSSVTEALRLSGIEDYTRASTRLTAVRASAIHAAHLLVEEGAPLLKASSINVDPGNAPVEYGRSWFVGDRVTLTRAD